MTTSLYISVFYSIYFLSFSLPLPPILMLIHTREKAKDILVIYTKELVHLAPFAFTNFIKCSHFNRFRSPYPAPYPHRRSPWPQL